MVLRTSKVLRILCLLLIPLFLTVGCAKRDAQKALELAQQEEQNARDQKAPIYAQNEFNDASKTLSAAKQQFEGGEYKQAIESAKSAQSRFLTAIDAVGPVKQRVEEARANVEDILTKANDNIEKARANLTPEDVNPMAEKLDQIRVRLADEFVREVGEEAWNGLIADASALEKDTESLALAHLKPQAADAIQAVQDLLTRAQELKADVHVPDEYNAVVAKIDELKTLNSENKWQEVIDQAETVKEPINALVVASQEKAAAEIIRETRALVERAKQLGVQDAPEYDAAVKQAEDAIKTGQQSLDSQDYAGAIAGSDSAKSFLAQANQSLGTKAQGLIAEAQANLETARAAEIEKYAPSVLAKVENAIADVEALIANQQFMAAFSGAKQLVLASKGAVDAAGRGKAALAMQDVQSSYAILQKQGGSQYAQEAYGAANAAMQELNSKLNAGQYEDVIAGVTGAVSVVNDAMAELALSAEDYIELSDKALAAAQKANAEEWVPVQYRSAVVAKSGAVSDLEAKRFLSSIQKAEAVIAAAKSAETKSYQVQTEQNLRKADELIAAAKQAEQHQLSPVAYADAMKARELVMALNSQGKNQEAYTESVTLVQKADRAFNNLVYTAREKTDSALNAKALNFAQPDMERAVALLNEAEEAQKSRNFAVANAKAQEASKLADAAEYATWKQRSAALLQDLTGMKERLDAQDAIMRAPALYRDAMANLSEAQIKLMEAKYKDSFDYAALAQDNEAKIWDTMNSELSQKALELQKTADWLGVNMMDQTGRELKLQLMNAVTVLNQQVALRNWKEAYAAADRADLVARGTIAKMESTNRGVMAKQLAQMLRPYQEKDAVSIVPEDETLFNTTLATLSGKDGATYTEAYQNYQKSLESIENLPASIDKMAEQRTNEVTKIMQQALEAEAPKYFNDWYRELSSDLQWLRNSIRGNDYEGIALRLKKLETEAPALLLATQDAIAEDNYLESLNVNINYMNNLLEEFGTIANMPKLQLIASRLTEYKIDGVANSMYRSLQGKITAKTLRVNAEILEDRVKEMTPPASLKKVHDKAIRSFMYFRKAAEGFEIFGNDETYDLRFRDRRVKQSYDYLEKTIEINGDILAAINNHRKLSQSEKFWQGLDRIQEKMERFYFSYEAK